MKETLTQLRKTKTLLSVVLLVVAGAALIAIGHRTRDATAWYGLLPLTELGGILVGAGILSVWLDAYLRREQDQLEEHRLRSILTEQAPVMRDAVLQAFAANHEDLKRVATPELLDGIIGNSLVPTKVLVETANLQNPDDRKCLADPAWRQAYAEAFVEAVKHHFGK